MKVVENDSNKLKKKPTQTTSTKMLSQASQYETDDEKEMLS